MNKDRKHIDDFFREKLSGFELPTSDGDFDAILAGLEKPKKKGFFLWLIIPLLLLSGGASWYILEKYNEPRSGSNAAIETNSSNLGSNTGTTDQLPNENAEQAYNGVDEPVQATFPMEPSPTNSVSTRNTQLKPTSGGIDASPTAAQSAPEPFAKASEPKAPSLFSILPKAFRGVFAKWPLTGIEIPLNLNNMDPDWRHTGPVPNDSRTPYKPSIELIAGTNFGEQSIPDLEAEYPRFKELKQNELPVPGMQLGLKANLSKAHNEFSSGVVYNEYRFINDQFTALTYDSIPFRNTNGDTIAWIRRNYRDSIYSGRQSLNYRSLSIPIQYGYNFRIGKNWALGASAGLRTSFFLPSKGISIDSRGTARFNSEIGVAPVQLNYLLGLQLRYFIDPAISLGLRTQYAGTVSGGSGSGTESVTRLNDLNFQINLRYEWNHR